jgi:Fe(3+) dicitrate transport protein
MRIPLLPLLSAALVSALFALPLAADPPADTVPSEPAPAAAQSEDDAKAAPARTAPISHFESLMVIGGPAAVAEVPGSATYLGAEELGRHESSDVNRILRTIPGVIVVEEEGYGLRPNIGMRGSGTERSSKITLLEDGILIAPAPYAAPAAYYFPTTGRMEAIEVRKGSTSIIQGPFTTGGALNLISTSIPFDFGGKVELEGGSDATFQLHATAGGSQGRFGWLVETYQLESDGFKRLDGGGSTGFVLRDYLAKFRFGSEPSATMQQLVELKLGRTEQLGDETYLGLTEADFRAHPYRRYRASAADLIDTEHTQVQLRHFIAPASWWDVTTSIYRNDFFRNWHKLDSVGGIGISRILDAPELFAGQLAIVRGEADAVGALKIRNNRRDYYAHGVQSVLALRRATGSLQHSVEFGVRYHEDAEDRFQEDDLWSMTGGSLVLAKPGMPGTNANRIGSARATALFIQDQILFGRWSVTPGIRFESIEFTREDFGNKDPERIGTFLQTRLNDVDAVIPGVGVGYQWDGGLSLFGGIHRGFAPPGPGASQQTRPEESINCEAGVRRSLQGSTMQLVAFFSDYTNLLGRDTLSSGGAGSGDLFNGGAVEVWGVEAGYDRDLAPLFGSAASAPFRLGYTHTQGEFSSGFETDFEDWAPRVEVGDELPYLPKDQLSATVGYVLPAWSAYLTAAYQSGMRTVAGQGAFEAGTGTGSAMILDATAKYRILPRLELVLHGKNLLDEVYIAARRPAGLRPGMPRTLALGFEWTF